MNFFREKPGQMQGAGEKGADLSRQADKVTDEVLLSIAQFGLLS
jgi:hypothetical protein